MEREEAKEIRTKALGIASSHLESMYRTKEAAKVHILTGKAYYDPQRCARLLEREGIVAKFWKAVGFRRSTGFWDGMFFYQDTGDVKSAQELLDAHPMLVHVEWKSDMHDDITALIAAAEIGDLPMVEVLLKAGADVNARDSRFGKTALMGTRNIDIVKLLLNAGAEVNASSKLGETALMKAAYGRLTVVKELLKAGADVNASEGNAHTGTAFSLADVEYNVSLAVTEEMLADRFEILTLLLKAGAEVNSRNELGTTALMHAAENGLLGVVKELLKAGADVNANERNGDTALHKAAYYGKMEIVQELLNAGADPELKNNQGESASFLLRGREKPV